jgi:hypothetical protein
MKRQFAFLYRKGIKISFLRRKANKTSTLNQHITREDNDAIKIVYQIFSISRDVIVAFISLLIHSPGKDDNDNDYQESSSTNMCAYYFEGFMAS